MQNSLSEKEFDYILEEYKILWSYYKKTLDERNEMLKNYSLFVGITSIFLTFIYNIININNILAGVLLIVTALIGVSISYIYTSECITSQRYLNKIAEIRQIIVSNTNIPSQLYNSKDTYNSNIINIINKLTKCLPLYLLNSIALFVGIYFIASNVVFNIILSSLWFILQVVAYVIW